MNKHKVIPWLQCTSDRKCDPVTALRRRATLRRKRLTAKVPAKFQNTSLESSMSDMAEYLQQRPHQVGALHTQATLMMRANRIKEAKVLLERALNIDRAHVPSLIDMANVLIKMKKGELALKFAAAAVSLSPHSSIAYQTVGAALARIEKYGPALKACRKALYYAEISHSDYQLASVHKSIAALHKIQGKTNASIPHLEMAIRLCPDDTSNYSRLSLSLVSEGRSRETHKYMRKLNNLTGKKFIR